MIVLHRFERADFDKLISWVTTEEFLLQWCGRTFIFPLDRMQLEKYIEGAEELLPVRKIYKAVDAANNRHVGNITLERLDPEKKSASVTCVIIGDAEYRGKGISETMMKQLIEIAFEELGLNLLALNVFDFNEAAIRCYKRCGFVEAERVIKYYDEKKYINVKMELRKNT